MVRWLIIVCALTLPAAAQGPRFASINLCTDQLLLDLADPAQIAGLSPFAADSARSWAHHKARGHRILSGQAEDVLVLRPDIVLAGTFSKRATRELLKQNGLPVEEFAPARSLDDARAQIRRMARIVGQEARGEARVAALDTAIATARAATGMRQRTALLLQRRGYVSGRDSLTTSLLEAVGLLNAASKSGGMMKLETILVLRPDMIVVSSDDPQAEDQGRALLLHPALASLYPPQKRLILPESLSICGGPMLKEALDSLTRQLEILP